MDYYGTDRKLSELGEQDLDDFLDQDMFTPPASDSGMDNFGLDNAPMDSEWLANFFDDPVLNDRMMTDALQPRRVQSEHSYSLTNGERITLDGQIKLEKVTDMEVDLLGSAINPNMTFTTATTLTACTPITVDTSMTTTYRNDSFISDAEITMATNSIASTPGTMATTITRSSPHPQTLLKQPTIILSSQHSPLPATGTSLMTSPVCRQERLVLPKVNIKMEPLDTASDISSPEHTIMYDSIGLPPTPPSSSTSDSEGSLSPQRSAPPSPIRHSQLLRQHTHTQHTLGGASAALSQPLFSSPQLPTSGVLILSEEEKRTLIAEGYPIPNKLPLTKQEEKNLKKIRRKIKNKISAQESRRKKKEYLETLEKKVESYNSENVDLKKKCELLENNNRSLLGQLHKLQSLVAKVPRPSSASSTQTGTCLMVLVLFFAVFIGTWSPMTLGSIGYHGLANLGAPSAVGAVGPVSLGASPLHLPPQGPAMGPEIQEPVSDPYSTPNMRSRVLLSIREEQEDQFGPHMPQGYKDFFIRWFSGPTACVNGDATDETNQDYTVFAPSPYINAENKIAERTDSNTYQIDMSTNYTAKVMTTSYTVNTTA